MGDYMFLAGILQVLVGFMLIMASNRMLSAYVHPIRAILGGLVGGIYCVACAIPALSFLSGRVWYLVSLLVTCLFAFGIGRETVKPTGMYCILRIALDGLAGSQNKLQALLWAGLFCGTCIAGTYSSRFQRKILPVELCYGEKTERLRGLVDTGHSLRDPVTGAGVLIVGADVAQNLTGLSPQQLAKPVENMDQLPGLRLIPYKTVGNGKGMLLAMQMQEGKIGKRKANVLVAFAPQILDETGKFQALIGGAL